MAHIRWPMAAYFDANILCRLPADLSSPDLVRLSEAATRYDVGRFVPGIAKREWIFFHQELARKKYDEMIASARLIGQYLGRDIPVEVINAPDLAAQVEQTQTARFEAARLIEIPTPAVDLQTLIERAVRRIKPFKEGDKGFRDTLIALTIAEHARQFAGHSILIVSGDEVFASPEVRRQWEGVGIHPLVARTLEDAVAQLEAAMDDAWKRYLDDEAARIRAFLVSRQQEIFDRLKDVEVSEGFIRGGGLLGEPAYYGTLERVRQVRPVEITRVSRGHVLGPVTRQNGRVPVTFFVKVAFDVSVRSYPLPALFGGGPRFRLAEAVDLRVPAGGFALLESTEQDLTVEREIAVQAWVVEDDRGGYTDLVIEKIPTW